MSLQKQMGADLSTIVFAPMRLNTGMNSKKASVITKEEALATGKQFAKQVRERIDPDALVFVFGSVVKGTAHLNSDIDIAVVSKIFDGDIIREGAKLSSLALKINQDIEIHDVALADWRKGNPQVLEIQRWGISI